MNGASIEYDGVSYKGCSPALRERFQPLDSGQLAQGELFDFALRNTGPQPLYVAVVLLSNTGEIEVLHSSGQGKPLAPGATLTLAECRLSGAPAGPETLKVLLSADDPRTDFKFLEVSPPDTSPERTKGPRPSRQETTPSRWGVKTFVLQVTRQKRR